jgi:hypothetical protein
MKKELEASEAPQAWLLEAATANYPRPCFEVQARRKLYDDA